MLKWFRKYNKIILIVGCAVLMVAFLIPQAVTMFSPQAGDFVVGSMGGQDVRERDLQNAAGELQVLGALGIPALLLPEDRETYLLQQRDAQRLGLGVSAAEVNAALDSLGMGGGTLEARAARLGVPAEGIRAIVANWLLTERYRMLLTGRRYNPAAGLSASPGVNTLSIWKGQVEPAIQQIQEANVPQLLDRVVAEFSVLRAGVGRISPAAVKHLARMRLERVGGRVALIEPEVDPNAPVDEAQLERLFNEYKTFYPGTGSPYPFGYRQPPRVDLEVLSFPIDKAIATVNVEPLDVLAYYRENKARLTDPETGQAAPDTPTAEVRQQIEQGLKQEKAIELLKRALSEARAALDADVRSFPTTDGYRELPDDFQPTPLEQVADRVEGATGFRPTILSTQGPTPLDDLLTEMPGFALSRLSNISAVQMLTFTRELLDEGANPALRAQAGVMMPATQAQDGTVYLPRLVSAEQAEVLDSLEPVREEVATDARRVAAFERLAEQAEALKEQAAAEGLESLASQYGTLAEQVDPLPRRDEGVPTPDGASPAPEIPGVGRSRPLIDAAFAVAEAAGVQGELTSKLPAEQRLVAVPIDRQLAVAVFEATRYEAPTRAAYEQMLDRSAGVASDFALLGGTSILTPLQRDALAKRLGFRLDDGDDGDDEGDATPEPTDNPETSG